MKSFGVIILAALIAAAVACGIVSYKIKDNVPVNTKPVVSSAATTSVYDRVMQTKTLRCGYVSWPPFFEKDVNTGKFSGYFYDYMEELGRSFGLKIEWTAETPLGDIPAALNTGRIDAFCLTLGAVPARVVNMEFSRPVLYFPYYAYARAGDTRFDQDMAKINDPAVTLATMEGEYTSILARTTFPNAKLLEITSNQGVSTLFLNVIGKKADVTFQDPGTFRTFDKENPGQLHKANGLVTAVPTGFMVKLGDAPIKRFIDYGVADLENRMITKNLLVKYHLMGVPGQEADIYLPTPGYQQP